MTICFVIAYGGYVAQYNEIYDEARAKRPAYAAFESRVCASVTQPSASIVNKLHHKKTVGNAGLYAIPLILDEAHFREVLVPGLLQRAFSLQELFSDLVCGSGKIVSDGLLSEEELDHILRSEGTDQRTLRRQWRGQAHDQIRFVYGPDLIRDPRGRWVVLEDNVGCVGGVAAGRVVRDIYLQASGFPLHPDCDHGSDLERALLAFLHRVSLVPGHDHLYGIPGVQSLNMHAAVDFETSWKANTLQSLGISVTQPDELLNTIAKGRAEPAAIINLSATLSSAYQKLADTVFTDWDIPVFGAPSVGLIASKSFHALGDALIALYLNEAALIDTPPTQLLREVPATLPKHGVLKHTNGCGGTEVFFLDAVHDPSALLNSLKAWGPCGAVMQERISQSVLTPINGTIAGAASIEVRPIVYVIGWRTAMVANIVSARAIPSGSNRHGNISRGAQFLPVLLEPTPSPTHS